MKHPNLIHVALIFLILIITLIPTAEARIGVWTNYEKATETISIHNLLSPITPIMQLQLEENGCGPVLNGKAQCYAILSGISTFDIDTKTLNYYLMDFYNRKGEDAIGKGLNSWDWQVYYEDIETYEVDVWGTCEHKADAENVSDYDYNYDCITGKEKKTRDIKVPVSLGTDSIPEGKRFHILLEGEITEDTEWIATWYGVELVEWIWWTGEFADVKNEISVGQPTTSTIFNYSYYINLSYDYGGGTETLAMARIPNLPPRDVNGSQWLYRNTTDDLYYLINGSETTRLPLACTLGPDCTNYTPSQAFDDNYYAYVPMQEGTGLNTYDWVSESELTFTNTPDWVTGVIGNALNFSPPHAEWVTGTQGSTTLRQITLGAWVRTTGGHTDNIGGVITDAVAGPHLSFSLRDGAADMDFYWDNTDCSGGSGHAAFGHATMQDGEWHFIVGRFDNATFNSSIWMDGLCKDSTICVGGGKITADGDYQIGAYSTYYFNGTIDEVFLYNGSMTNDEIVAMYESQKDNHQSLGADELIDTTPPQITVISPANTTYSSSNTQIGFNISLNEEGSACNYSLNRTANVSMTADTNKSHWNATITGLIDGGVYSAQFYCNDTFDNWNMSGLKTWFYVALAPSEVIYTDVNWTDLPYYTNSTTNYTIKVIGNTSSYNVTVQEINGSTLFRTYTISDLANNTMFSNNSLTEQHAGETWNVTTNTSHILGQINSTIVIVQNTAHEVIVATITPAAPTLVEDITLTANVTDIDEDVLSANTTFFINGLAVYSYNQSITSGVNFSIIFGSGNTSGNDVVIAQVDAYDGTTHILKNTSSVTVTPTYLETNLNWTSLPYYTNSTTNYTYKVYGTCGSYNISVDLINGSTSFESFTLNDYGNDTMFSNTTTAQHAGETWNISINTSCVGLTDINSTIVVIQNTHPEIISNVVINTTVATKLTSQINCSFNASDIDGNASMSHNYRWYRDNIFISLGSLLANSSYDKGDVLICEGWANDASTNSSLINSSSLTIGNTAPTIGTPTITPATAYTNSTLNCSVTPLDIDFDSLTINFTWYNGSVYHNSSTISAVSGNLSSALLPSGIQALGEIWNCTTFVNDGTADSFLTSITKTILNYPPILTLTSPANRTNTTDNTYPFVFNYTDVDGTAGNCILYVNATNVGSNASVTSGKATTITSSALNEGLRQKWYVNCTDGTNTTQSEIRMISIDATTPALTIYYPTGEYFTQSLPLLNIDLNFSYVEENPDSCWYGVDTIYTEKVAEDAYSCSGDFDAGHPCSNAVDGNWSTRASSVLHAVNIWENFTFIGTPKKWEARYFGSSDGTSSAVNVTYWNYTLKNWQQLAYYEPSGSGNKSINLPSDSWDGFFVRMKHRLEPEFGVYAAGYYEGKVIWENITISSCANTTFNQTTSGNHTLFLYMNDTFNNIGSSSSGFSVNLYNVSHRVSMGNVTETEEITFSLQINSTNITSTNATLYYNDTAYGYTTVSSSNNQANFTRVLNIPLIDSFAANRSYYWNYTINSFTNLTGKKNLTVHRMGFAQCNATYTTYSLNFSIRNESDSKLLVGDLEGTFYIWYTSATSNRTYIYSGSNSSNYTFCIYPAWASYYTTFNVKYSLSGYPQRSYSQSNYAITNTTSNLNLYLTPVGEGIYVRFAVVDSFNQPIKGVAVQMEKLISGSYQVIETQTSDDSGLVTFWVDPDNDYKFTFRKTGYTVYIITLRPTSSAIYYVSLEEPGVGVVNESVWHGVTYTILPSGDTILENNTAYTFSFDISSSTSLLDYYQFDLYNSSGDLVATQSGTTTAGSTLSTSLNVGNGTFIRGQFYFDVNGTNTTIQRIWKIKSTYKGRYSIMVFFEDLESLTVAGMNNFTRLMIAFIFIFGVTAFLSSYAGIYSAKGIVGLIMVLVAITSFVGFLTVETSTFAHIGGRAGYWLAKYSLALAIELLGAGILFLNPTGEN